MAVTYRYSTTLSLLLLVFSHASSAATEVCNSEGSCSSEGRERACKNNPQDWKDSNGYDCAHYEANKYCRQDGAYGEGWIEAWGTFPKFQDDAGIDATQACCACGGGDTEQEDAVTEKEAEPTEEEGAAKEQEAAPTEEEGAATEQEAVPTEEMGAPMEEADDATQEEGDATEEEGAATEQEAVPTEEKDAAKEEMGAPMEEADDATQEEGDAKDQPSIPDPSHGSPRKLVHVHINVGKRNFKRRWDRGAQNVEEFWSKIQKKIAKTFSSTGWVLSSHDGEYLVEDEDDFVDFVDMAGDHGLTKVHLRVVASSSSDTGLQHGGADASPADRRNSNPSNEVTSDQAFSPKPHRDLQNAIKDCLKLSTHCSKGPNGPIRSWDVSAVTDMRRLFSTCSWNKDRGEEVTGTKSFNGDISKWDVSSVVYMSDIFCSASSFNSDVSKWDVSNARYMTMTFYDTGSFNGDISKWAVSSVINMDGMFAASAFNDDISKWDVSSVTSMHAMFSGTPSFNSDISKWDVSRVTDTSLMFHDTVFHGDISEWDVSNVRNMYDMFSQAKSFNSDISKWDVSSVTDMSRMFERTQSFNGDISKWNVSKVTNMKAMFHYAWKFTQTLCGFWANSTAASGDIFRETFGKICTDTVSA